MAAQQGKYLAKVMNTHRDHFASMAAASKASDSASASARMNASSSASSPADAVADIPAFKYQHLGSMASVGDWKGVIDTPNICKCLLYLIIIYLLRMFGAGCVHHTKPFATYVLRYLVGFDTHLTSTRMSCSFPL